MCSDGSDGVEENVVGAQTQKGKRKTANLRRRKITAQTDGKPELPFQSAIDALSLLAKRKTPTDKLDQIVRASKEIELNTSLPT